MSATQYPIVTISGSMRYYQRMLKAAERFTEQGWIVLMPFSVTKETAVKEMLDDMHQTKISMSDLVYVVGKHIGESTSLEIAYALDKSIVTQYEESGENE